MTQSVKALEFFGLPVWDLGLPFLGRVSPGLRHGNSLKEILGPFWGTLCSLGMKHCFRKCNEVGVILIDEEEKDHRKRKGDSGTAAKLFLSF